MMLALGSFPLPLPLAPSSSLREGSVYLSGERRWRVSTRGRESRCGCALVTVRRCFGSNFCHSCPLHSHPGHTAHITARLPTFAAWGILPSAVCQSRGRKSGPLHRGRTETLPRLTPLTNFLPTWKPPSLSVLTMGS